MIHNGMPLGIQDVLKEQVANGCGVRSIRLCRRGRMQLARGRLLHFPYLERAMHAACYHDEKQVHVIKDVVSSSFPFGAGSALFVSA